MKSKEAIQIAPDEPHGPRRFILPRGKGIDANRFLEGRAQEDEDWYLQHFFHLDPHSKPLPFVPAKNRDKKIKGLF